MDFQIILLPRMDYWSWVRASGEYVLRFGPNLTPDPVTAANYMAPRQVITFPIVPGGYAEQGDLERWFQVHHPGIRLDPINAETPAALKGEFGNRILEQDRYGQKRRPFSLAWPTDYPVITQEFGANPQIYSRWGFPGHEGIDFRARNNTNVYVCADGEVYRVHTDPDNHPYGIHVRIFHKDGYKTVYAHLAKALVKEGEKVQVGQIIGKADATGASTGAHLHLTLKRDGATERGETDCPKDVIDPTPYLIWPEGATKKTISGINWAAGKCLIGAHGRVGGPLLEKDLEVITKARLEAVKIELSEKNETIERIRDINPATFLLVRISADFSKKPITADEFLSVIESDVGRFYRQGIRYFEVHVNPNLQVEGWQRSWRGGDEFSNWFLNVVGRLRHAFPEAHLGFPGLSPGGLMSGWRADASQFLYEADEATAAADWIGVNCYWTDMKSMKSLPGGQHYREYRNRYPDKLLIVTEFHNPALGLSSTMKGQQYLDYFRMLRDFPGMGAVFAYAISAVEGHTAIVWRTEDGLIGDIPTIIGDRSF